MDAKDWICPKCTLLNDSSNITCEACGYDNEKTVKETIQKVEVISICDNDNDDDIIELDPDTDKPVVKNCVSNSNIVANVTNVAMCNTNASNTSSRTTVAMTNSNGTTNDIHDGADDESQLNAQFDEDEDQAPAETYITYQPKKCK